MPSVRCPQQESAAEQRVVLLPSCPLWPGVSQGKSQLVQDLLYRPKMSFTETAPKREGCPNLGFSWRLSCCCLLLSVALRLIPAVDFFASVQL